MHTKIKQKNTRFTRTLKNFSVTPKGGGFTLVETLVAIAIFSVSILGLMSVLASSISNTNYAKQKTVASYLAQEGIEYIRNTRDTNIISSKTWNDFGTTFSSCTDENSACDFSTGIDSGFTRQIWIKDINTNKEVQIFSKVSWNQGSGTQSVTFSENLFNWYY